MEQFNLDTWLQDKSRKVVTREGKNVEITYTNSPVPHHPIVGFIDKSIYTWTIDGKLIYGKEEQDKNDLFFADEESETIEIPFGSKDSEFVKDEYLIPDGCEARIEGNKVIIEKIQKEEELTELQKTLEEDCDCYVNLYNDGKTREELREWIKCWCPCIIDLVRKELMSEISDFEIYDKGFKEGKKYALKDLPKWKKATENKDFDRHVLLLEDDRVVIASCVYKDEYYIELNDLRILPKDE